MSNKPVKRSDKIALIEKWVDGEIDEAKVEEVIDNIVEGYKQKVSVFAMAVFQRKMKHVSRLLNLVDHTQEMMEQQTRWEGKEIDFLVRAHGSFQRWISRDMELLLGRPHKEMDGPQMSGDLHLHVHNDQFDDFDQQAMERVRKAYEKTMYLERKRMEKEGLLPLVEDGGGVVIDEGHNGSIKKK